MATANRDIEIIKGDDYSHVVTIASRIAGAIVPDNITGRTYTGQINTPTVQPFTIVVTNAAAGQITLSLTDAVTASLPVGGCYHWFVKQDAFGVITTILRGKATIVAQ